MQILLNQHIHCIPATHAMYSHGLNPEGGTEVVPVHKGSFPRLRKNISTRCVVFPGSSLLSSFVPSPMLAVSAREELRFNGAGDIGRGVGH